MSRVCTICDKRSKVNTVLVKLRGNYNPTTKRRKYPNLQWTTVDGKRVKACTKCIKTASKNAK